MKYIDINLRGAREPCTSYIIGSAGENIAEAFLAKIPDKYLNCNIVFEFQMENGEKYASKPLPWAKEIIFEMPYYLMVKGRMVVAITAVDKTSNAIYRLFEKTFVVTGEITANTATQNSGIEVVDTLPDSARPDAIVYLIGSGLYRYSKEWHQLTDDSLSETVTAIRDDLPTSSDIARWDLTAEDLDEMKTTVAMKDDLPSVDSNGVLTVAEAAAGNFTVTNAVTGQHRGTQGEYNLHVERDGKVYLRRWVNNAWNLLYSIQLSSETMSTLAKISEADGVPLFDGMPIAAGDAPDDVVPLELREYASLLIREDLDAVPIYVTDGNGFVIGLYADPENPDTGDMISLTDVQDTETGLPVRILRVRRNGEYAALYSHDNHYGGLLFEGGVWYRDNTPVSAPSLSGFTPTAFCVCDDWYTDLSDLPPRAVSALRSLSQCVNVDAASMGTITVPDDTIQRFAGTLEPDRHYTQQTGLDMTLTLPPVPWKDTETVTQLDLVCTRNITLTLPREKLLDGGTLPDTTAGSHTLIFTYIPTAGKWSVGCVNRVQPQYWDDIPDSVIPLEDCTWAQIKSIAEHGYVNRLGQWCIRRNNEEEVWFEIGDEKTVVLTTGETWTVQLWDFNNDNLADGSGKAPFTFGMNGVTADTYRINNYETIEGGWETCDFRRNTSAGIIRTMPDDLQSVLADVLKNTCISMTANSESARIYADTADKLFIPTWTELGGASGTGSHGGNKYTIFNTANAGVGTKYALREVQYIPVYTQAAFAACLSDGTQGYMQKSGSTVPSTTVPFNMRLAFCV